MTWLQRWRRPDPQALAAGLTAEWTGRGWRYHDPILRTHLTDRHAVWGPVTYQQAAGQRGAITRGGVIQPVAAASADAPAPEEILVASVTEKPRWFRENASIRRTKTQQATSSASFPEFPAPFAPVDADAHSHARMRPL